MRLRAFSPVLAPPVASPHCASLLLHICRCMCYTIAHPRVMAVDIARSVRTLPCGLRARHLSACRRLAPYSYVHIPYYRP